MSAVERLDHWDGRDPKGVLWLIHFREFYYAQMADNSQVIRW
jgi:hypothetical protein